MVSVATEIEHFFDSRQLAWFAGSKIFATRDQMPSNSWAFTDANALQHPRYSRFDCRHAPGERTTFFCPGPMMFIESVSGSLSPTERRCFTWKWKSGVTFPPLPTKIL